MSEIVSYQRSIEDVTRDIHYKTGQFLRTAIDIGRLLFEAKAMAEPGGWSKYIEEEFPFSHSWANNYMKLYKEFGSDQTSLFGDSQAFMNLRTTQALELLALPAEKREEFVETHDVAELSTRQLRQAVQAELEEERRKREEAEGKLVEAQAQVRDANQNILNMQQQLSAAKTTEAAWQEEINKLKDKVAKAEKAQADATKKMKKAKETQKAFQEALKQDKAINNVPEDVMAQLRAEMEAEATQRAAEDAKKAVAKAEAEAAAAVHAREEAEKKLAELQKKIKMADPAIMEFDTLSQKLMADYNVLDGLRRKITVHDKEAGEKLKLFQKKMVSMWSQALGGAAV